MLTLTLPSRPNARSLIPWGPLFLASGLLGMGQLGLTASPAIAQITEATITEIIAGDAVFIEPAGDASPDPAEQTPVEVDAVASFQDTIRTEDARAALLFDNGAAGRLGPNSQIKVGQCIEVQAGLLLAAGPANGCTATFAVGVEGTIYTIGVDETGTQTIKVLEGEVMIALAEAETGNPEATTEPTDPAVQPDAPADASDPLPPPQPERLKPPKQIGQTPATRSEPAAPDTGEAAASPAASSEAEPRSETESSPDSPNQTLQAGEQIAITPEGKFGEKRFISAEDMLLILAGVLFADFEDTLPGMAQLQATLEALYPDLDLPRLPGFDLPLPVRPSIPRPF